MKLLEQRDAVLRERRERRRVRVRADLREALGAVFPGVGIVVFGSINRPGEFRGRSDVDLALDLSRVKGNIWKIQAELEERLGCPVDLVDISKCRFRDKILAEGETWTG